MAGTVHVVGAGVAGLGAAVRLAGAGHAVVVHEAAGQAGGRCRSFSDATLGRVIDNGNHLLLGGNSAVAAYLAEIGAGDALAGPDRAEFPFRDLASGRCWTVRMGPGPWWMLWPAYRVPGSNALDYLRALRLANAGPDATVAEVLGTARPIFRRFWEPLAVAVLNARPDEAAARLLWPVLCESVGRGETASRPRIARTGLGDCFVAPALATLTARGAQVRFNDRLKRLDLAADRVAGLDFGAGPVALGAADAVVLAVPPAAAADMVPGLVVPSGSRAIVNAHFRLAGARPGPAFLGLIGGVAQWLFLRRDIASVTVSAADALAERPSDEIAALLWADVARALDLGAAPIPAFRIVKEKRATFAQVPANLGRRPGTRTRWPNLVLAGDWTATGLPATIEGALRSGHAAAAAVRAFFQSFS